VKEGSLTQPKPGAAAQRACWPARVLDDVDDELGPGSDRAYLERNAIGLVSNLR